MRRLPMIHRPVNTESSAESPLTVVVARQIRAGCEGEYERTMREFVAWSLTRPGHQGLHVLRPAAGERDYTVVSRFRDEASRRAFTNSPEYAVWMARLGDLTEGGARIQELTGLEGFVTFPGHALMRPPTWKLAVSTFLGVFPTALALSEFLAPRIATWPLLPRAVAFNGVMVVSLTWIVMPIVTRALHGWLFPKRENESTT